MYRTNEQSGMSDEEYLQYLYSTDDQRMAEKIAKETAFKQEQTERRATEKLRKEEERITRQHQRAQNMADADYVGKIKKAGSVIYKIIFWTFSIFMLLFALVSFTSSGILSGILFLITAVLVNPLSEDFIRNKLFYLPKWGVIVVLIIGFFAGVLTFPQTNDVTDSTAYYEIGEYSM